MGGAPGERAGLHEGGQTAVTVSRNSAHRAVPAHLSGWSLLVRRAPVASRGMIRGVHTFQAGVALTTLNEQFGNSLQQIDPLRDCDFDSWEGNEMGRDEILPDSSCATCSSSFATSCFEPCGRRGKWSIPPATWTLNCWTISVILCNLNTAELRCPGRERERGGNRKLVGTRWIWIMPSKRNDSYIYIFFYKSSSPLSKDYREYVERIWRETNETEESIRWKERY